MQIPDTAFTHGGKFHADDVFSAALLKICNPNIAIQRGFAVPQGFAGLVFDIGDGPFDHHAKNSPVRENGVPYAAFGLLWRELGPQLVGPVDAGRFDESFVQPLDLDDNTGCGNQLANIIAAYNPRWDGEDRPDDCFAQAVALAQDMLAHKLEAIRSVRRRPRARCGDCGSRGAIQRLRAGSPPAGRRFWIRCSQTRRPMPRPMG